MADDILCVRYLYRTLVRTVRNDVPGRFVAGIYVKYVIGDSVFVEECCNMTPVLFQLHKRPVDKSRTTDKAFKRIVDKTSREAKELKSKLKLLT
ncbi:MAG: hypothetical protein ACLSC9_02310 [Barnesiella sp.]